MSRKHFIALAMELNNVMPDSQDEPFAYAQWEKDCNALALVCNNVNSNFSWQRFIAACKGE